MPRRLLPPVARPHQYGRPPARRGRVAEASRIARPHRIARAGPSNSARKSVPRSIDLLTRVPCELAPDRSVVRVQGANDASPRARAVFRRANEIGEGVVASTRFDCRRVETQWELLGLVEDLIEVVERHMVVARKLDEARAQDARRDAGPRPPRVGSPVRWRTSVGHWTLGRTSLMSAFEFMRMKSRTPAGLSPAIRPLEPRCLTRIGVRPHREVDVSPHVFSNSRAASTRCSTSAPRVVVVGIAAPSRGCRTGRAPRTRSRYVAANRTDIGPPSE